MHVVSSTPCSRAKTSRPAWKSERSSRPSMLLTIREMPMTSSCKARNSSSTATTNRLCTAWRSSLTTIGFRASSSLARIPGDFIGLPLGAGGGTGCSVRSTQYRVRSTTQLWHGLPTVPPKLTGGLPNKRRPGGRASWHGQETVPQQGTQYGVGEELLARLGVPPIPLLTPHCELRTGYCVLGTTSCLLHLSLGHVHEDLFQIGPALAVFQYAEAVAHQFRQ